MYIVSIKLMITFSQAGLFIMDVAYGIDVLPKDDPYIETAEKALAGVSLAVMPGAFLVDIIPARVFFPPLSSCAQGLILLLTLPS